jgi:hypothetical protein
VDKTPDTHVTSMTLEDAAHFTGEQREKIQASYPAFERDAEPVAYRCEVAARYSQ